VSSDGRGADLWPDSAAEQDSSHKHNRSLISPKVIHVRQA
jgi:hypothetical protein